MGNTVSKGFSISASPFLFYRWFQLFGLIIVLMSTAPAQSIRKIAFAHGNTSSSIDIINEDGSGQTRLTAFDANNHPSWSPDGSQIVFQSLKYGGRYNILRMNADGTGQVPLTDWTLPVTSTDPAWSPDGSKIVFVSDRDGIGKSELWLMNADGTNLQKLTTDVQFDGPYSQDLMPAWSPDGLKIAFSSSRDGLANPEIYTMNADGSNQIRLTDNTVDDVDPAWSPDSQHIVFFSKEGGRGIYVMDSDGTNRHQLLDSGFQPSWSPDGLKIAFSDLDPQTNRFAVYLMNADGTGKTRITNNADSDSLTPAWQTTGGPHPPPPPGPPTYSVSGRVVDRSLSINGTGVPGVTITLSGSASGIGTTDGNGRFFFGSLTENGTFTVTASTPNWGIAQPTRTFSTSIPLIGFVGNNLDLQFDASPIFLEFISSNYSGREGSNVLVTVVRQGFITGTSTIDYSTSDGTAVAGKDYLATSGTLQFNPFEQSKTFSVPLLYDKMPEPDRTLSLVLSNPTGSISRGRQLATLTVSDPPPVLFRDGNSSLSIALNADTFQRDPFSLTTTSFLGQGMPTRVALFAGFIDFLPNEDASAVTVRAIDSLQHIYQLPVETVSKVPSFDWLTQINVTTPNNIATGDLLLTVTFRGLTSDPARIRIK
jgi:Tol biopolymer transport system component